MFSSFLVAAAAVYMNGDGDSDDWTHDFDWVHMDEYLYEDLLSRFLEDKDEYDREQRERVQKRTMKHTNAMREYMLRFARVEDDCGFVANEYRKKWRLGERLTPLRGVHTDPEEMRKRTAHEILGKIGPPPAKPSTMYKPFQFVAHSYNITFLLTHSAKVRAFMEGSEGWVDLFFERDYSLFEGKLRTTWELEQVRQMMLAMSEWPELSRPALPSVNDFVDMCKRVYPK